MDYRIELKNGDVIEYKDTAEIREAKVWFREGSYEPHQLGLYNLPLLKWVHIGYCVLSPNDGIEGIGAETDEGRSFAHAHCRTGQICMRAGTHIFSEDGVVDEILIHEYCHLLAPDDEGHGAEWEMYMGMYGLEPSVYMTYVYR